MRLFLVPAALFAFLAAPAVGDDKPDAAADLKAMVGKWKVTKAELGGMDIIEHVKDMKFEIAEGGKYTAQLGEEKDVGAFTIDVGKTPREMDVKPTGGPGKGKTIKAVYKLDGDTLTVCYDHSAEGNRPTKFETKNGSTELLMVYKREKK